MKKASKTSKRTTTTKRKTSPTPAVALRRATISQTKNHLSQLIERVRHGETITIVDRDQPVAQLVPVMPSGAGEEEARLQNLERAGLVRRGTTDPRALAQAWTPVQPRRGADILQALLDERQEDWR